MKLKDITTVEAVRVGGQYETFLDEKKFDLMLDNDSWCVEASKLGSKDIVCIPFANIKQFSKKIEEKPAKNK
jgi:NADH:ubiquinone oxidoreductase subunit F (NADH-binding)